MKTIYHVLVSFVLCFFCFGFSLAKLHGQESFSQKRVRFHTYFGISKSNYFYSRAPSAYSEFKKSIDNSRPSYNLGVESLIKLPSHFKIGIGLNFNSVKFHVCYSNFVNPNLLDGFVSSQIRHQFISIPMNLYWKVPISTLSSAYFHVGAESFKTISINKTKSEYLAVVRNNGSSDNNANIQTQFQTENLSLFRIFNAGIKFELNQFEKNRICFGINYYLMRNFFPIQNKTIILAGDKIYETNNSLYFEGLRFSVGYIW
jgi:hypothetical protein